MFLCVRELGLEVTVLTYMMKHANLLNKAVVYNTMLARNTLKQQ